MLQQQLKNNKIRIQRLKPAWHENLQQNLLLFAVIPFLYIQVVNYYQMSRSMERLISYMTLIGMLGLELVIIYTF